MVNSGTEATMSAVRVARGLQNGTGSSSSRGATMATATVFLSRQDQASRRSASLTVPASRKARLGTRCLRNNNDPDSVKLLFEKYGEDIAALIVEPVAGNMGVVPPLRVFLRGCGTSPGSTAASSFSTK